MTNSKPPLAIILSMMVGFVGLAGQFVGVVWFAAGLKAEIQLVSIKLDSVNHSVNTNTRRINEIDTEQRKRGQVVWSVTRLAEDIKALREEIKVLRDEIKQNKR